MNTERLFTISKKIQHEINAMGLISNLDQLVNQLREAINYPSENTQRAVEDTLNQLYQGLDKANSKDFSPGIRSELDELIVNRQANINTLIGLGLSSQLQSIFAGGYTSVQSLDQLRALAEDVTAFTEALEQINTSFTTLGIKDEELNVGESVVGMTIPREGINGGLRGLQREIAFFAQFLVELTEVIEGSTEENEVYSLHASDFGIDVMATLPVAAQFAAIVAGVKAAFDMIKDFKNLKEKAEELGVDEDTVNKLTEKGEAAMETKLDEIHAEIFQDCKVDENGRVNELKSGMKLRLNGLANRMDQGFSFEVRTSLPESPSEEDEKHVEAIRSFGSIKFEPLEGSRLLELPENEDDEGSLSESSENEDDEDNSTKSKTSKK